MVVVLNCTGIFLFAIVWTLIMPDDIVLYAEFEDAKAPQTVFDPSHLNEDGSFAYTLVVGEDVSMPPDDGKQHGF